MAIQFQQATAARAISRCNDFITSDKIVLEAELYIKLTVFKKEHS